MSKLWKQNDSDTNKLIETYTVGKDYLLDQVILPYDILASKAHAEVLKKAGVLSEAELSQMLQALDEILQEHEVGEVEISIADEDCHTVIEKMLVEKLGSVGKKIHSGRSRNDQVLTAVRLYLLATSEKIADQATVLAEKIISKSDLHQDDVLAGHTHMQQAMLSSFSHYLLAYAESLIDDIAYLNAIQPLLSQNPLGSAAGYGVNLDLDRKLSQKLLNFRQLQVNSLYCQNSKGKLESLYLKGLSQIMLSLGKIASDFLLFTTQEFSILKVNPALTTGSSIMPQKQNLDFLELLRANVKVVSAQERLVSDLSIDLISGYNRDLQLIKEPLITAGDITFSSLEIIDLLFDNYEFQKDRAKELIHQDILTADIALELATKQSIPFRDAYLQAKSQQEESGKLYDYQVELKKKQSLGSAGNPGTKEISAKLRNVKSKLAKDQAHGISIK